MVNRKSQNRRGSDEVRSIAMLDSFAGILDHAPEVNSMHALRLDLCGKSSFRVGEFWSLAMFDYFGGIRLDGVPMPIRPGYVLLMPPGTLREYEFQGSSPHRATHFRWRPAPDRMVSLMFDSRDDARRLWDSFDTVRGQFARHARRADAWLWDVLWRLQGYSLVSQTNRNLANPNLQRAVQLIESMLDQPLTVAELAEELGLSHNQLTRIFRQELGTTVVAYIRRRRMLLADHFIRHSNLPIKVIAAQVGVPDLQVFNRMVRRELGKSPRALRESSLGYRDDAADAYRHADDKPES